MSVSRFVTVMSCPSEMPAPLLAIVSIVLLLAIVSVPVVPVIVPLAISPAWTLNRLIVSVKVA